VAENPTTRADSPILRASRKLVHEEHLITNYAALRLRFEALDLDLWRDVNHLDLKKLGGTWCTTCTYHD